MPLVIAVPELVFECPNSARPRPIAPSLFAWLRLGVSPVERDANGRGSVRESAAYAPLRPCAEGRGGCDWIPTVAFAFSPHPRPLPVIMPKACLRHEGRGICRASCKACV